MNLRGVKVFISVSPFLIPPSIFVSPSRLSHKTPTLSFIVPSLYCSSRLLLPLDVAVFGMCEWKLIQISFPGSYWNENRRCFGCRRSIFLFVCSLVSLSVAPLRGSATWLPTVHRRPYSQCKHVRAAPQGDRLGKVSQGQCCCKERRGHTLTHTHFTIQ